MSKLESLSNQAFQSLNIDEAMSAIGGHRSFIQTNQRTLPAPPLISDFISDVRFD
ncbi:MAG TPA: hypothetical protein VEZ90_17905 [Blastocatellia bacterium]|nr:hypothetical protein [Blastocatellia bacterium]